MATFIEKLDEVVSLLGEMGTDEDAIGDLSYAQASLFHLATQMLQHLEDDLIEGKAD